MFPYLSLRDTDIVVAGNGQDTSCAARTGFSSAADYISQTGSAFAGEQFVRIFLLRGKAKDSLALHRQSVLSRPTLSRRLRGFQEVMTLYTFLPYTYIPDLSITFLFERVILAGSGDGTFEGRTFCVLYYTIASKWHVNFLERVYFLTWKSVWLLYLWAE